MKGKTNQKSVAEKIIQMINECCAISGKHITIGTEIKSLSLDSLSFIQLIVNIETEFSIEFYDDELNINAYKNIKKVIQISTAKMQQS